MNRALKFSLVLATVGRTHELRVFLDALLRQNYSNLELIVVDQNPDDRVTRLLLGYSFTFPVLHLHSAKGLSRARNVGLHHITGEIIGFPDDDCFYPDGLLFSLARIFAVRDNLDVASLRPMSKDRNYLSRATGATEKTVTPFNVWDLCISPALFFRRGILDQIGGFDEKLGAGCQTPWSGAEETDLVLRALEAGYNVRYLPLIIQHPCKSFAQRGSAYAFPSGSGVGWVMARHRIQFWHLGYRLSRNLGGVLLSMLQFNLPKTKHHWTLFRGRCYGWWQGRRSLRGRA